MISIERATHIAMGHLETIALDIGENLDIDHDATMQGSNGWLFFWNTKEYLEEGSISAALAGNGPILVHGETGVASQLPADTDLGEYRHLSR